MGIPLWSNTGLRCIVESSKLRQIRTMSQFLIKYATNEHDPSLFHILHSFLFSHWILRLPLGLPFSSTFTSNLTRVVPREIYSPSRFYSIRATVYLCSYGNYYSINHELTNGWYRKKKEICNVIQRISRWIASR